MPPDIKGPRDIGSTTLPPLATPQGKPQPTGGGSASLARPDGLTARNGALPAGMAPRQNKLKDAQPPASQPPVLGTPVGYAQPYMAAHYAAPPMVLPPQPQIGGAFGGGGFMQKVRNAFQQVLQFPQQLHQLAQQASHYPPHTLQHALHAAQPFNHGLHAGGRPPVFFPPPPPTPVAGGIPIGIPMGWTPPPAQHVEEPMVLIPRPQIQGAAQQFTLQAQLFDSAALKLQAAPLVPLILQHAKESLDRLLQSFQAAVAHTQQAGSGAAAAVSPTAATSPAVASPGGGPGKLKQD